MKKCLKKIKKVFGKDFKKKLKQQNYDNMTEIGDIIHNYLMKHNQKYKKAVETRRKMKETLFKDDTKKLTELEYVIADSDIENLKAHFMLGLMLGIELKA